MARPNHFSLRPFAPAKDDELLGGRDAELRGLCLRLPLLNEFKVLTGYISCFTKAILHINQFPFGILFMPLFLPLLPALRVQCLLSIDCFHNHSGHLTPRSRRLHSDSLSTSTSPGLGS
jgi:hypothetical protein